jgi:hypothetical protein
MIRRGFWLAAGAMLGVAGYRKATRLARTITAAPVVIQTRAAVPVTHRVREAASFASDVRDGMAEYRDLHPRQLGRRLGNRSSEQPGDRAPAGRGGSQGSIQP